MKISKLIHKRTRIKTVLVSLLSIVYLKEGEQRTILIGMEREKYYWRIVILPLLPSLCNNAVYTKRIHKHITNKMVSVLIVFYCVFKK